MLFNTQRNEDIIYIYHVTLTLENVKIINNTVFGSSPSYANNNIILAELSYIRYKNYNQVSKNSADFTIKTWTIHICENSILIFSSNSLTYGAEIYSLQNSELDICVVQYISDRGNLVREFQMGRKLNYSIIHNNKNKLHTISNIDLNHCEWESTSAFLTSSPLHVNQRIIQCNISLSKNQRRRCICLCHGENPPDCYIEELGPFFPGETVSFNLTLFSMSTDTALL